MIIVTQIPHPDVFEIFVFIIWSNYNIINIPVVTFLKYAFSILLIIIRYNVLHDPVVR